jgi:hypothetical protein
MIENGCETNWNWQFFMFEEIQKWYHNIENESGRFGIFSSYFHP